MFGKVRKVVYRVYQSVGYGWYGSRTELTKVSGTGGGVWMLHQAYQIKVSGMVRLLVPDPDPDPDPDPLLYLNKAVPGTGVFCRGRTELTKTKCRVGVRVWMSYRTYKGSGTRRVVWILYLTCS